MQSAKDFFTKEEQLKIKAAVKNAEQKTSGEIVPMVVDSSYDYPRAELIGSGVLALTVSLLCSWGFGNESIWSFLPIFITGFFIFKYLIQQFPDLKRKMIHPDELTAEVKEKAFVSFIENGIHETRDRTGILILISLFEHRVQVLADSGINDKVPEHAWEEIVEIIVAGLKNGTACDATCVAIERCSDLLENCFPRKDDDTDELPNLIIGD